MDQALKARLIGAAILVALAVLVIPELLSGRRSAEPAAPTNAGGSSSVRTYTIELGATPAQNRPADAGSAPMSSTSTTQLPAPGDARSPSGAKQDSAGNTSDKVNNSTAPTGTGLTAASESTSSSSSPSTPDATGDKAAAATPPPAASTQSANDAARPSKGTWSVQVGAFGSADAARKLKRELDKAGYAAYVSPMTKAGKTLHRVRVGPEPAKASAESLAARLKSRGLPASVVANN
jgi:DedD protein